MSGLLDGGTLLLGHRGDPEHHAENTVEGFAAAMRCGADGVELDVHLSADGVPVVIHDETLERTTSGAGAVGTHTWQELGALGVPRLDEVFAALPLGVVAVEMKPPHAQAPGLAAAVLESARRAGAGDRVLLLSFDHAHLSELGADATPRVALVRSKPDDPRAILDACGAIALAPWWEHVDETLCQTLRQAGRAVVTWTVDDPDAAARLAAAGVAAIISNRPCALRDAPWRR